MGEFYLAELIFLHPICEDFTLLLIQKMDCLFYIPQVVLPAGPDAGQEGEQQSILDTQSKIVDIVENHQEVEFLCATVPVFLPFERKAALHELHEPQFPVPAVLQLHQDPHLMRERLFINKF
jgi:hypothetical protein